MSFSSGGVLREPLDGEPGARGERPPRRPAGVDRAVVEHEDHRPADPTRRRTVLPAEPPQQVHEVAGPLGAAGGDDQLAPGMVEQAEERAPPAPAPRPAGRPRARPGRGRGRRRRRRAARKPGRGAAALPPPRRRSAGTSPRAAPGGPRRPPGPRAGTARGRSARGPAAGVVEEGPDPAGLDARPAVPEYCRCTPADLVPFLTSPVPSSASTAPGSPGCSTTYVRGSPRPASASRRTRPGKSRTPSGARSPAAPAGRLAPRGGGETARVGRRPPARPGPPEPRREPSRQPVQAARPPLGFAHVRQARPSSRAERPNRGCGSGAF